MAAAVSAPQLVPLNCVTIATTRPAFLCELIVTSMYHRGPKRGDLRVSRCCRSLRKGALSGRSGQQEARVCAAVPGYRLWVFHSDSLSIKLWKGSLAKTSTNALSCDDYEGF